MSSCKLGKIQGFLLSEIFNAGGWVKIENEICGSNYGGKKKHLTLLRTLEERDLVKIEERE